MSKPLLHVTKLKNGKYKYSFEKAKVDGKRNRAYGTFNTEEEAWVEGRRAYNLYYDCGVATPKRMTYAELVNEWVEKDCRGRVTEYTIESYKKRIKYNILPYIGDMYLDTIQNYHLNNLFVQLNDKGCSRYSQIASKAMITSTFRFATVNRFIPYDPSYNIKLPTPRVRTTVKTRKKDHVVLSDRDMYTIYEILKDNLTYSLVVKIGYECGLRRGEIFGLFWEDVDLIRKQLTVRRQIQYVQDHSRTEDDIKASNGTKAKGNGFWYYKPPKFDSIRTISISNELVRMLKEYKQISDNNRRNENIKTVNNYASEYPSEDCKFSKITNDPNDCLINPLFVKENGELLTTNICLYITQKIHNDGVVRFDMHSLRKTHSTILQNSGFNLKYISTRLGHVDTRTTTQNYYDLTPSVIKDQEQKLDQLYEDSKKHGVMQGDLHLVKDILEENEVSALDEKTLDDLSKIKW